MTQAIHRPEITNALIDGIRAGLPYRVAAHRAGISESTFHLWQTTATNATATNTTCPTCGATDTQPCQSRNNKPLTQHHKGRAVPHTPYVAQCVAVMEQVRKAEADAHAANLARIQQAAAAGTWQAAAWFLERRYPEQYGRFRLEVSGPDQGPVEVSVVDRLADAFHNAADQ